MGIPFLLTALFVNWALGMFSVIKKYFGYIETTSGIILIIVGVILISGNFSLLSRYFEKLAG